MRAILCILLLAGIAFSAAGSVPTESFLVNVTNPYIQGAAPTESFPVNVTNPFIQAALAVETFGVNVTSLGVDYPVILDLSLSPNPVNFRSQPISISANVTSAYSQDISNVTANVTGCGEGVIALSLQSGTCSSSCVYAGSFSPMQGGVCEVNVKATDLAGKSGYAEASVVSSSEQYMFTGLTGPDGVAGINITSLPGPSGTMRISAGGGAESSALQTSASSLYMNVLVRLGSNPASNKEVTVEVV